MTMVYHIAGYDKRTMRLVCQYAVPATTLPVVMGAAHISLDAAAEFGSVLLDPATVKRIGSQINKNIYSELCDWVLEPFGGSNSGRAGKPMPHYRV